MTDYPIELVDLSGIVRFKGTGRPTPGGGAGGLQLARLDFGPDLAAYDPVALAAGLELATPGVGALIYDLGIAVLAAFDGTSPLLDIGTFGLGTTGLLAEDYGSAVGGATPLVPSVNNAGLLAYDFGTAPSWRSPYRADNAAAWPIVVTQDLPLLVVGSQDGTQGGDPLDSLVGEAVAYVLYAPSA